jgi:hypothetical protein
LASLLNGYAPMFIALGGLGALAAIISLVGNLTINKATKTSWPQQLMSRGTG